MPNLKVKEITLNWLADNNACNLGECRKFFGKDKSLPLTAKGILIACSSRLLGATWLAERILTPEGLAKFNRAKRQAWDSYRRAKAIALADIVAEDQ